MKWCNLYIPALEGNLVSINILLKNKSNSFNQWAEVMQSGKELLIKWRKLILERNCLYPTSKLVIPFAYFKLSVMSNMGCLNSSTGVFVQTDLKMYVIGITCRSKSDVCLTRFEQFKVVFDWILELHPKLAVVHFRELKFKACDVT